MEEPLHPTWSVYVWAKVRVDIVYMPETPEGYKFAVFARDDLSGWIEGQALKAVNTRSVAGFLFEEVMCRHRTPRRIVMDGRSQNMADTEILLEALRVQKVLASPYHPQTNGLVERSHDAIVASIGKYCHVNRKEWPSVLHLAMWADRISVHRSTGYSAFEMVYGRDVILPVDLQLESWRIVDWRNDMKDRETLLLARMKQLDERNLMLVQAAKNLGNSRKTNEVWFDWHHQLQKERLEVGDLVLVYNAVTVKTNTLDNKLKDHWQRPYRIRKVPKDSTHYYLEELDGVKLKGTFAGDNLKLFYTQEEVMHEREAAQRSGKLSERGDGGESEGEADMDRPPRGDFGVINAG